MRILNILILFYFALEMHAQSVGIGTTNPSDALHIVGAANDDPLRVQVGTATKLRVLNNGGTTLGTNNTSGTPANGLYVQGNTGLGINNPIDKLEVNGNANVTGEIKTNGVSGEAGQLLMSNGNGTMTWAEPCGYKNFREFSLSGANQWLVPTGVSEIMVEMWGAGGGGSSNFGGGAGGYIKFKRPVISGSVINFTIGDGGSGKSSSTEATDGTNTSFPANALDNHTAYGGSKGLTGLGGSVSVIQDLTNSVVSKRGQHGHPLEMFFYKISDTEYATITNFGDGGSSYSLGLDSGGFGGRAVVNSTANTNIFSSNGRPGSQPGGGGGGGAGSGAPFNNSGGSGGDGYVIIYWN